MMWWNLQDKFLELQRSADGLCANWNCAGWNEAFEQWYVSGPLEESVPARFTRYAVIAGRSSEDAQESGSALFKTYASIAGETVLRRAGGDPKYFFWLDLLSQQEPNYEAQKVGMSTAVFFWLDLLKKDSPNFSQLSASVTSSELQLFGWLNVLRNQKPDLVVRTCQPGQPADRPKRLDVELGTIVQVCRASADYCERLNGGYVPAIKLPRAAQRQPDSEHGDLQATRKSRERSHISRAVIGRLAYHPTANGLELSEWLDEQGVEPTHSIRKIGYRSIAEAYRGDARLRNSLDSTFSRIRRNMRQKLGALT